MRNTPSSPDRPKVGSHKVSKAKKKRSVANAAENLSGEESNLHQSIAMSGSQEEASLSSSTVAPPKVEVSLPGPLLHRSPSDSKETQARSAKPLSKIKAPPSRASSVVSLKDAARHGSPSIRPVRAKSSESTSPAAKTNTPHHDADETASITESFGGHRIRRSEPERIQYFREQSTCDSVEPRRAHCKLCDKWISLGNRQLYAVRPWENHRRKCDRQTPISKDYSGEAERGNSEGDLSVSEPIMGVTEEASPQSVSGEAKVGKQEPEEDILLPESNTNINQPSPKTARRNDAERKAFFEADPRAQEVRPDEALCRSCQKWIKLGGRPYQLSNWNAHQQRCSGVVLSRVATTERKISLLSDPQVKECSSQNVECAFCRTNVELDGVAQYDLTNWYEHKAKCSSPTVQPTPKAPVSRRSRVFSTPSDQSVVHTPISGIHTPAISLNSTPISRELLPRVGEKRTRDEEEILEDRPVNRPRTETYQAPKHEVPGPWGWFMQPLKAFVRGFREGLGTPST